jgi:hypothetical protein
MRLDPFVGAYLADPAYVWRRLLDESDGVHHDPGLAPVLAAWVRDLVRVHL